MSNYEVEWADGIKTRLTELNQQATYAGLIEGIPTLSSNEYHIFHLVNPKDREKRLLLWAPQREFPGRTKMFMNSPTSLLPAITCVATFHHSNPVGSTPHPGAWASYREVAWFQEEWAFPIIDEVLAQIKSLKWGDVAIDYEV